MRVLVLRTYGRALDALGKEQRLLDEIDEVRKIAASTESCAELLFNAAVADVRRERNPRRRG